MLPYIFTDTSIVPGNAANEYIHIERLSLFILMMITQTFTGNANVNREKWCHLIPIAVIRAANLLKKKKKYSCYP